MNKPHYYLMKNKKILRLEADQKWDQLSYLIRTQIFDQKKTMNQEEANWRVAIFRDEIMEMDEYVDYLNSPQAAIDAEAWAEAV
ncbi:MAG: hypothetical protein LW878_08735 [Proteobacteria bacterium]|jgi:hypothetical protein|nr:hypothetical protein [Pseudomonadota bacterium]